MKHGGGFTDHGPCMVPEKAGIGSMQSDKPKLIHSNVAYSTAGTLDGQQKL